MTDSHWIKYIFLVGLFFVIAFLFIMLVITYNSKKSQWNNIKASIYAVLKNVLKQVVGFVVFTLLIKWLLDIDLLGWYIEWWAAILNVFLIFNYFSVKWECSFLSMYDHIENVYSGATCGLPPEETFQSDIDSIESSIEIQKEKLDWLKKFAPASVIPLLFGYFINNGWDVQIELNKFMIFFFVLFFLYFYCVDMCFKRIKTLTIWLTDLKKARRHVVCNNTSVSI